MHALFSLKRRGALKPLPELIESIEPGEPDGPAEDVSAPTAQIHPLLVIACLLFLIWTVGLPLLDNAADRFYGQSTASQGR